MDLLRFKMPVRSYNLALTLQSGQTFRWNRVQESWEGVIGRRWVRLSSSGTAIQAETVQAVEDGSWLTHYLQTGVDLEKIQASFPPDEPMRASLAACPGLRLLRQDPWECLASFLLSSCKQIVQIQQIVAALCQRCGEPVAVPAGHPPAFAFPGPSQLADRTEGELRACKMGWRARFLLETSRLIAAGAVDLSHLQNRRLEVARQTLLRLPGVGPKIADCVLLFACGFQEVFPIDVWVEKALHRFYFPKRKPSPARLRRFTSTHFGSYAGYAQQYLFHYMRTLGKLKQTGCTR